MLRRLKLTNYKGYASLDLTFERLTVLVGPNGSGKTTVLDAISRLSRVAATRNWRGGLRSPEHLVRRGQEHVELVAELDEVGGTSNTLQVTGRPDSEGWDSFTQIDYQQPSSTLPLSFPPALSWFGQSAFLRLDAAWAAEPSYSNSLTPTMDAHGAGLASTLAWLKLRHEELFEQISEALRTVTPHVRRVRLDRVPLNEGVSERPGDAVLFDTASASAVRANEAGDGTILVLALLTKLLCPPQPNLLLLDDLELALHPRAQKTLIEQLRKLLDRFPKLQIVATSHSPFVLDCLKYEEVRQTVLTETGEARAGKLVDHPEYERWRELMSPGEFWSTVGEEWLSKAGSKDA